MASRGRRTSVGVVEMARDLGVSTATVSRALNGSPSVRRELANRLARALSASTSRAFVGFVVPFVDTPAYSAVAAECARLLSAAGPQMILAITENDPDPAARHPPRRRPGRPRSQPDHVPAGRAGSGQRQ